LSLFRPSSVSISVQIVKFEHYISQSDHDSVYIIWTATPMPNYSNRV